MWPWRTSCGRASTTCAASVLDVLYDSMDALALGVAIQEMNWCLRTDGLIGLASIKAKDPSGFLFECDPFLNITAIRGLPALTSAFRPPCQE